MPALLLLALTLFIACKTQPPATTSGDKGVRQSQGVYQYRDEEPAVVKSVAGPFFSDRQGVIGRNGMVASAHPDFDACRRRCPSRQAS